jgi:hypothetical protein
VCPRPKVRANAVWEREFHRRTLVASAFPAAGKDTQTAFGGNVERFSRPSLTARSLRQRGQRVATLFRIARAVRALTYRSPPQAGQRTRRTVSVETTIATSSVGRVGQLDQQLRADLADARAGSVSCTALLTLAPYQRALSARIADPLELAQLTNGRVRASRRVPSRGASGYPVVARPPRLVYRYNDL